MAEAGPSSPARPVSPPTTPSSSPHQRVGRIHFPAEHTPANDNGAHVALHSLGLGPPPALRKSVNQPGSFSFQQDDKRRRVKSVDASNAFDQARFSDVRQGPSPRRTTSFSRRAEHREPMLKGVATGMLETFSDEFDLSREDPGVLEDVQRALRLKARREARLKAHPAPLHVETPNDAASLSSVSAGSLPGQATLPPFFPRQPRVSGDSEIDFSPSIGVMPLHPVPSSSDGGTTLDWTTPMMDDGRERRWSLSKGKRKPKEQSSFSANKAAAEKQEALYATKLEQIRATVQPQTLRKVEIVRDQLARKYTLLVANGRSPSVTILEAARWYSKQGSKVRASLDQTERVTWMKHIWEKHATPAGGHSMWSPTALVMEEYVRSRSSSQTMDTIPENEVILPASPHTPSFSEARSPTTSSWTTPRHSLEAAISRKRSSYDVSVSFGPYTEPGRDPGGSNSRRSSDNHKNGRNGGDSAPSSLYSMLSRGTSPNSSRKRLRDFGRRLTPRLSDEVLSSAQNSISENSGHSASEDGGHPGHQKGVTVRVYSRPASLHLHASPHPPPTPSSSANGVSHPITPEALTTATQSSTVFPTSAEPTPRAEVTRASSRELATIPRRRHRRSLPSSSDVFALQRERRQRSAGEHKEREEYEAKSRVLNDTVSQNYRMRSLLQRVCTNLREYDSVQMNLSDILRISYSKIPQEVLDAFLHDPSAVIGKTRRKHGWRAAEDIHLRVQRQQETLHAYRCSLLESGSITPPQKVFKDPVTSLMQSLDQLAAQREYLTRKAEDVSRVLKHVKGIQASVKKEYNDTLAHTSLVYPELSQIAALDENIRNHYQQFWDIGLDALTFILDTVTPFWRNYGKVIGEDIQDFLIIPLYRNEFTGEPKRYPIEQFPRRSLRHWCGLAFLSFLSFSVAILQTRAAWSLTVNINLPWISHMGLRWIIIPVHVILLLLQWCAVLVEFCILAAQAGVIVWWMGWFIKLVS